MNYTVERWPNEGSTLWGIARKFYGDATLWPIIYQANMPNSLPNMIYAGQKLVIPGILPVQEMELVPYDEIGPVGKAEFLGQA